MSYHLLVKCMPCEQMLIFVVERISSFVNRHATQSLIRDQVRKVGKTYLLDLLPVAMLPNAAKALDELQNRFERRLSGA